MEQNVDLEMKVIKRFVKNAKRERYLSFLTSTKGRAKFVADLHEANHFLQMELFKPVTSTEEQTVEQALRARDLTSTTCYVISEDARLDKQTLLLREALQKVVGWGMATLLVFGDAEVLYYEGEGKRNRYISR